MSTSPVPAIIDQIMTVLAARPDLDGVTLRSGPFDATGVTELLQLNEIIFEDDQETMGPGNREVDFRINGVIECTKFGAGESVIAAARARAFALMDQVESALIAGIGISGINLKDGEIVTGKYVGALTDGGHLGHLEFTIHVIADLG